ncbi:cytochrome P450 [Streptomyces sp. NPDC054796]
MRGQAAWLSACRRTAPLVECGWAGAGHLLTALSVPDARGRALDDGELQVQTVNLLVAGSETNAMLMVWILHLLDRAPDVQQRV